MFTCRLELIDVLKVLILSTDMQRQQEYLASFKVSRAAAEDLLARLMACLR